MLWEDEVPESMATGRYANHDGLLVATHKRAIFIHKGLFSRTVKDFPYGRISSVEYREGFFSANLSIHLAGTKARVGHMRKGEVRSFAEHLRRHVSAPTQRQLDSIFVEPTISEDKSYHHRAPVRPSGPGSPLSRGVRGREAPHPGRLVGQL